MEKANSDIYNLSSSIYHHKNILRTIACNGTGVVVTGSFDKTCAFFSWSEGDGGYIHLRDTNYHDDYVYVVRSEINNNGFFSGSKDRKIILMDNTGNPLGEYLGHSSIVNDISQAERDTFISGSWDTTAKVWDVEKQTCLFSLKDHSYAVCTLALPGRRYITGSQDKKLRLWDGNKIIKTIDNAHEDIIRSIILSPGGFSFYTCSNDYTIKHWSMDGTLLNELTGHDGFIFRLGYNHELKLLASGGDDKVVKIWKNETYSQDLFHPNTIWDLAFNKNNNDLLTACADGVIRVFSNSQDRWLGPDQLEEYNNLCLFSNKEETSGNNSVDLSKLPNISEMRNIKNPKEGDIRAFNNNGVPEVYIFQSGRWEKQGDVIGMKDTKKFYPGDKFFPSGEYDYVFNVELDGKELYLPFNKGDNCLVAAEKFIIREGLNKNLYVDDVTKFLRKNTQSVQSSYQPVQKKPEIKNQQEASSSTKFPVINYQKFDSINVEGPIKKIEQINEILKSNNDPLQLSPSEFEIIKNFINTLGKTQFYHTSNFNPKELDIFLNKLERWSLENIIIFLDCFRMYLLHPRSNDIFQKIGGGIQELTIFLEIIKKGSDIHRILVMRILNNMFIYESSRIIMIEKRQEILDNISVYIDTENKNLKSAIYKLFYKYVYILNGI